MLSIIARSNSGTRSIRRIARYERPSQILEAQRAEVSQLEVTRATAVVDLSHLGTSCTEAFELSIEQVQEETAQFERDKTLVLDPKLIGHADEETEPEGGEDGDDAQAVEPAVADLEPSATESTEQVIGWLRTKIGRMGPVNMMAIDQFDELEERYEFLTTQRKDLLDSIQATGEAIKRIDVTTRERFLEAFTAVNDHFQMTFSTLFGGGRAGLVLIDESDLLESRYRHHRPATRQAATEHSAAIRRRKGTGRYGTDVRYL